MLSLRVLIVDDEANQREMLAGFLAKQGYQVSAAASGEQALELAQEQSFEIGLFDMKMPGITGVELMARLHQRDPELQVIVITAFGSVETAVAAMQQGAFSYLCKPVNLDELLELLKNAGEKHHLLNENRELRERLAQFESAEIIGKSKAIEQLLSELVRVAPTEATVLITGE
ncbi:MAG: response regulator, partial [bacterium]